MLIWFFQCFTHKFHDWSTLPDRLFASDSGLLSKFISQWIAIANLKGPSIFESVSYKLSISWLNALQYIICPKLLCLSPSYAATAKKQDHPTPRKMQLPTVCFSTSWITTSPSHACISPTGPPVGTLPPTGGWRRFQRCSGGRPWWFDVGAVHGVAECRPWELDPFFWGVVGLEGCWYTLICCFVFFWDICFTLYKGSLFFCCWFWLLKVAHFDGFYGFKMIWTTYDFATFQSSISLLSLRNLQLETFSRCTLL